ncbi:MAG TPA: enolase [Clostridiales bacterium]|jgi:prepilin signal peptidase PulO-like enzyme (type II secretory pathway)|nr:enolase [Clostridiales bacterium]
MDFGFAPVMAITVICYLVATILKVTPLDHKWLPAICGFTGGLLGVIAKYIGMPDFPAADWLSAIAIGMVSGLAATGAHQIGKQLSPRD